ncbi:LOW QUALITY PROTEIN: ferritin heavy chain [Metopolophium dirhodum]|uniref:LOW QUALITY PROTEIN: ferritin heavy chain n=1 Tax=Metopolophium dirhodum TaxID=44670 RepID=UPI0029902B90|nr:LOW QUALITY PROTEIN: ferritin heavy chain [Metopolophium dirhodum]
MFKLSLLCVAAVLAVASQETQGKMTCKLPQVQIPDDWITMVDPCTKKMKEQVQEELTAAMTYFAMGAHFSKDTVNRPGFAKIFFDSASEERDHAIKIIGYLLMRGGLTKDISQLIRDPQPLSEAWTDGLSALKDALKLEAHVTRKIRDIATTCEEPGRDGQDFNDYHLVDWLTGDFLTEQYEGQRDLAGKISNLGKMLEAHGALGEFLFDKKLLNGVSI